MLRVVIIDAHEIARTGLKAILSSASEIEVVGEAQNVHDGLNILMSTSVDVLITELSSAGRGSIDLIGRAKHHYPELRVLVLAAHGGVEFAARALRAGASGFLTTDADAAQIIIAVRRLAKGHVHLSDQIATQLMSQFQDIEPAKGHKCLTNRELDVFVRIALGETCTEIGRTLSLSPKTISTHKSRIMQKMKLASTSDIVQYAVAHKLISPLLV